MVTSTLDIADYIYYPVLVSCAVVGNSLVIISIIKFHSLRSNANYLVCGLAVSDLIMACTWPVLLGINRVYRTLSEENYTKWETACKVSMMVQTAAIFGDFLSIFLITIDRFLCINFPLRYEALVTRKRVYAMLWVTVISAVPSGSIMVWAPKRPENLIGCSLWTLMHPFLVTVYWTPVYTLLTLVILSIYLKVAYLAYQSRKRIRNLQINLETGTRRSQSKTTKSLLLVLGVFTSTYTIWLVVYFLTVGQYSDTALLTQKIVEWLWQTNIWINPFIYALKNKNFKTAFRKLLHLKLDRVNGDAVSITLNSMQ